MYKSLLLILLLYIFRLVIFIALIFFPFFSKTHTLKYQKKKKCHSFPILFFFIFFFLSIM
ncbi:uncharacterized protein BX664DRAFT_331252 [Halteromyces radiatus]|uniref:uncharacterized protein n=1 Tax=Halteromyces radiatus TaxID=101107 RepID=UPI00221E68E3|nr:uncharacterized protein BX664DRAFT_331252 [Halteromyces radiatus]KAI8088735.1 hypothetical protein BX664DRAFT_331252 [Halteromyces radiatus]